MPMLTRVLVLVLACAGDGGHHDGGDAMAFPAGSSVAKYVMFARATRKDALSAANMDIVRK